MSEATEAIEAAGVDDQHRAALRWFLDRTGQDVPWPNLLADGTFLVNKAKGIHKPKGWVHALSVRESVIDWYPDRCPFPRERGAFAYSYHQEGEDPNYFTNRGLRRCLEDRVPVGVFVQVKQKPDPRYRVWGIAVIESFADGVFELRGLRTS